MHLEGVISKSLPTRNVKVQITTSFCVCCPQAPALWIAERLLMYLGKGACTSRVSETKEETEILRRSHAGAHGVDCRGAADVPGRGRGRGPAAGDLRYRIIFSPISNLLQRQHNMKQWQSSGVGESGRGPDAGGSRSRRVNCCRAGHCNGLRKPWVCA